MTTVRKIVLVLAVLAGSFAAVTHATTAQADAGPASFTFDGGGFGHGVGMSQYGAQGMAVAGSDAGSIVTHYYTGAAIQPLAQPSDIRVLAATTSVTSVTPSSAAIVAVDGQVVATIASGERATIRSLGSTFQVDGKTGPVGNGGSTLRVGFSQGYPIALSATGFRYQYGYIDFMHTGGSMYVIVGGLSMQQYLYGLGEVPSSWAAAALQTQAIAGRSYAKEAIDRRRGTWGRPYDLDGSTLDQAYIGFEKQSHSVDANWVAAVDATDAQVATYNGATISAMYSSSSGGYTENSEYVFSSALPYLRGVPDPGDAYGGNPLHAWSRTYATSDISRWLDADSRTSIGTLTSVTFNAPLGVSGRIDKANVQLVGTSATKTVSGNTFKSIVNSGVAGDGGGLSSQFPSTLIKLPGNPFGNVDSVDLSPSGIRVRGWAIDPDTVYPIQVHVYFGGSGTPLVANVHRPDVGAQFPGYGADHGFDATFGYPPSDTTMCIYAINTGPGTNTTMSCRAIGPSPMGSLDTITRIPGGLGVSGWTIDPETSAPTNADVYAGAIGARTLADQFRPDVGAAFPAYGPNHGYSGAVPASAGAVNVCSYGINVGNGANALLGCRTVPVSSSPFGYLDVANAQAGDITVMGWAIDPDVADSITVHVYMDGHPVTAAPANVYRGDVYWNNPPYGPNHGYALTIPAAPGNHTVCTYGINVQAGTNSLLQCKAVTSTGDPFGSLDVATLASGQVHVSGWAIDPDTSAPIDVHVYVAGTGHPLGAASLGRSDVYARYPNYGPNHGFDATIGPAGAGQVVCAYGIDVGPGNNALLGCRQL